MAFEVRVTATVANLQSGGTGTRRRAGFTFSRAWKLVDLDEVPAAIADDPYLEVRAMPLMPLMAAEGEDADANLDTDGMDAGEGAVSAPSDPSPASASAGDESWPEDIPADLDSLEYPYLKRLAAEHNLGGHGNKLALIKRLATHRDRLAAAHAAATEEPPTGD